MIAKPEKYHSINPTAQNEPKNIFWFKPSTQNEPKKSFWVEQSTQNEPHNFRHSFRVLRMNPTTSFGSFRALRMSPATSFGSFRAIICFQPKVYQSISEIYTSHVPTLIFNRYNSNNFLFTNLILYYLWKFKISA